MQINMYIFFNGNCEEAMNYYKGALNGKIESIMRYNDAPMPCPDQQKDKVMHGVLEVDGTRIYFSDSNDSHTGSEATTKQGGNFAVSLSFKSDDEITKTFNAISAGGQVTLPLQDMFWGAKFGMCTDKFGVNWMFNCDKPKV